MKWPSHGANPHYVYETAGIQPPKFMVDFSANINPLGPPAILKSNWQELMNEVTLYPDPKAKQLKEKIAYKEEIHSDQVLIGNGAAEIIALIGRMLAGKRVLLIQPTFSEYEEVCRVNNAEISYFLLSEKDGWDLNPSSLQEHINQADAVFLCNPSNPTGRYYGREEIQHILKYCEQKGCYFILDEAFYDFALDYESSVSLLHSHSRLIILRSLTKMYSIPGIRLGYVLASKAVIEKLQYFQPQWSINGLALKIGEWLLTEEEFVIETQQFIQMERRKLESAFQHKFQLSPSQANFYLLRDPEYKGQEELLYYLLKQGIIARHTYNYPGLEGRWLRFAIRSKEDNERLQGVLDQWK